MKPEVCKNCCASEFIEQEDTYVCAYCNSRYHKTPVRTVVEVRYAEVPVQAPISSVSEVPAGKRKNKWIAFFWCLFLGPYGAHKFYEGRIGAGILYLFTAGLLGIGWIADCIALLCKPNPYYVN